MAEFSFPFDAEWIDGIPDRSYSAQDFANFYKQLVSNGVVHKNNVPSLRVRPEGGTMRVILEPGSAFIEGKVYINTTDLPLTVALPDATRSRFDRVVIRLDNRKEERRIYAYIAQGIPAEEPTPPPLTRNEDVFELSVARIFVTAGKAYIDDSQITDERLDQSVCGVVSSLIEIPTDGIMAEWKSVLAEILREFDQESTRAYARKVAMQKAIVLG